MMNDELEYKKEHKPLEYVRKLKELNRDAEARDCYRNARKHYFAYVQEYLEEHLSDLRDKGELHRGK